MSIWLKSVFVGKSISRRLLFWLASCWLQLWFSIFISIWQWKWNRYLIYFISLGIHYHLKRCFPSLSVRRKTKNEPRWILVCFALKSNPIMVCCPKPYKSYFSTEMLHIPFGIWCSAFSIRRMFSRLRRIETYRLVFVSTRSNAQWNNILFRKNN